MSLKILDSIFRKDQSKSKQRNSCRSALLYAAEFLNWPPQRHNSIRYANLHSVSPLLPHRSVSRWMRSLCSSTRPRTSTEPAPPISTRRSTDCSTRFALEPHRHRHQLLSPMPPTTSRLEWRTATLAICRHSWHRDLQQKIAIDSLNSAPASTKCDRSNRYFDKWVDYK